MSARDPNSVLTLQEKAAAFFAAHGRLRDRVLFALSAAQLSGFRGLLDVGFFYPSAPLADKAELRASVVPLSPEQAAKDPPFGWVRYEVTDRKEVKRVTGASSDA